MKLKLKLQIQQAIQKVLDKNCEDGGAWEYPLSDNLILNMTNASEAVFDAGQDASKWADENKE